jgi:hypothetical protein
MIELTPEQLQALGKPEATPVRAVNPQTREMFVLVPLVEYERLMGREDDDTNPVSEPGSLTGLPEPTELARRFRQLADQWRKETAHLSNPRKIFWHAAYREIIGMGKPAVPLILAELKRQPEHWFVALRSITGADPVPAESQGKLREMAAAWLRWGEEKGR